ncbi:uncharacterized protein LOC130648557 [Hydractinia symbiolongicarpus]|uniref:uncharacterized protein LOC130648557 n=1 Tax=Hydractinia symbiolongicarpus TaxID=13093 RepID=UPI0025510CB3|nr:uncharacterized protein LOC130648557 [Hydractinia symbiolongicarpus]
MNYLFDAALSPNTRLTYRSGLSSYRMFCHHASIRMFPLIESHLQLYVTFMSTRVKYATIKVYLCGIQYQSLICGFSEKIFDMGKLYYVMRGIRRTENVVSRQRLPITPSHLHEMLRFINNSCFSFCDKAMWRCLILFAFFGLLRVSEYVCPYKTNFDPNIHLSPSEFSFSPCNNTLYMTIKSSKTDPFRKTFRIRFGRIQGDLCPVKAFSQFLVYRGTHQGPWFVLSNGEFVTRILVSAFVKISVNGPYLNTHSFRIGGASAAACCGIPDSAIKILGRLGPVVTYTIRVVIWILYMSTIVQFYVYLGSFVCMYVVDAYKPLMIIDNTCLLGAEDTICDYRFIVKCSVPS